MNWLFSILLVHSKISIYALFVKRHAINNSAFDASGAVYKVEELLTKNVMFTKTNYIRMSNSIKYINIE